MAKIQNTNVSAATQVENKKVKKQQQKKEQQVFKGNGNKQTVKKPNDSALKQEIYKKTGFQLKDTANRGKIIPLKVNGKVREYETVGTLTTGGRILVKERGKEVYHVVSHTKDNKLVMLKDDYAKNKIFYESTSSEHKVKYGKKNYVITNSKRDRHGRMSAIDENGKRVVLSSDGKELKTGYVEAEDQKDNMNDYIAKQTKGKSKAEADKIRQQILSGNSSYSNKGVLRFKASNGEVWYYDTKRKTYVKYAEKEAQAIIKNLDKGATENWLLFRTGLGTDYELLKNTNAQIIDPEVLNKVNKHYSAEYGNKVDKNAQYGSGKYKTAYEAFLASEIGDDEVYQFNAALVKNNAITDQSRRNEILQTNLTKISGFGIEGIGVGVNKRANRMAAADAASTKEDYQALQDAAEEENKKKNYKPQFKGQDALQTYIYGVHDGDVQEIDDFNTTLIDPKEDMLDRDEIVRIKAETGVLWAKKGLYNKAFESQDSDVTKQMFALQSPNGKSALDAKLLKKQAAEKHQDDYLMMARPDLYSEDEIVENVVKMLQGALASFKSAEDLSGPGVIRTDDTALQLQASTTRDFTTAENLISRAYSLISNNSILSKVKAKMGDDFNVLMKKEDAHFKTNSFKNVTSITDKQVTEYSDKEGKVKLTPEQIAHNKYVVTWLKSQLADLERDKKLNEAKDGWKQDFVNWHRETYSGYATRSSIANKYQLIKSNMARLEAAAEGKLVDASGKPVSFEDAMKNLGETGIQALEHANADYQTAQQTGEFMVDMAVLALPLPKGFNAANTVIKMGNVLYKVISKSDKACKVIKITQEAAKGSKIYEVVTNVATKNPKFVENARKVATILDSSATGAMHMAGKTVVLDASNIATSREGFTSDRISEMNKKVESASLFGGMGGAIGGSTAVASEFVSSAGAKYTVHGVGLVADLMGAAGLMTAESHGETNFWDNLRCVNPDGSFNFEQASMTAMMIFGHLHGMSAIKGKPMPKAEIQADGTVKGKSMPKAEIQADGTVKYTLNNRELVLSKDGIFTDSETGRKFKLAKNKNSKAELTELTKKEVAARHLEQPVTEEVRANSTRHSEAPAEESRGTSTQQIKSFKERINNAKTREELNAIRDDIKKTDLTVQERNELMTESLKVQREWSQAPERRQIVNMAAEGEASVMGKPELTALRQEVGIKQSKPGLHFEGETNGANTVINEMKGNDTVNSYIVSRDVEGKAHIEYKVSYENGKATDVEIYNADGTIKELPAETKQAVLDELNKPAETDPVSHSERSEESQAKAKTESEKPAIEKPATEEHKPVAESKGEGEKPVESNKPAETDPVSHSEAPVEESRVKSESHSERSEESQAKETPTTDKPVVAKEAQVKTETDKIEYVRDENGNVIKEIHKGDNLTREILKDAEGNVLESIENVYDSQGKLQKTIHKDAKGYTVAIYDNVNKRMVFDIREKSVNNNAQADSKPESHKHAESLPENWEIPENNMTTFRRNKNAVTDIKNINPEDISVDGNYTGYTHFSGPSEKSLGVNGDIRTFVLQQTDIGVAYDKAKNITIITTKINDAYNRPGIISIKVKGQVSEADGIALVKNLEKANAIPKTTSNIELSQELDVIGRRIQQETAKFFNEKQTNSARDIKAPVEESRVNSESHSERSEESQVAPKTEERKPVVENKGEGDKPVVKQQAKEPAEKPATEKPATENSVIASESEAIQPKQKTEGKTPVTSQEQSTGKTPEEAAAIYNEEMKTAGVTPVQQTKAQQLELERLQTLVQSKEGQVILADAMKDPNFGKPISERVPDEGFKMTEDGRLQIEVDGVVYTQRNEGDFRLVSSDGKILEDNVGIEPKYPSATDNPNLTRLYRNGDGKIFGIENQYGAIDYRHTSPEYYPAGKPNTSLNLSLGRPTENYIMTDNVGRVMFNGTETRSSNYFTKTKNGSTTSDSNIVSDLNQAIQDVNLKNTTFSTKKGRQKAYEDVRTQIENAYKDNKLTGQDYENLVANLNAKAEKAGGLIVKETRYQQYVAKRAEVYETNRDLLSDKIDKVATKSDYDNMVAEINESFKSGKIDREAARVLNETLDAKGELIEGVETLSQKKAKIEKQVREIETAQRIEEVEANSQHRAELLDEYLAEFGENLPSEIGTKEYYDEALSTIDRGVKSGLIEPQKAEVLRTQAKEQLAKLELESSQPATEPPVVASESEAIQPKPETNATSTESNKPSLNVNDKRIQETMTIEDAKGLAKKYDNVEVVEHENGNYELKVTYKDADGNIKATIESEHINGKVAKEIIKDTTATGIQEDVYNSDGNVVSSTIKDVDGNVIRTTESEYQNGKVAKSIVTEYKDGKVVETAAYEYDGGKATKKIQKDAEGNITEIYDYEQRRTLTEEEIKEYLSNKDNNTQTAEKPAETDPISQSEVIVEESRGADSNQSANVEPKAGKEFNITTEDIPTKLSDMQEFVEKNSLNALSFKVDDNTILYSIKNDETGGVMHVQFTDGKRSNMTIVKANDLQTYIEFAEDGVTPSKVRTDFIDNGKIFTRVEDKTTGQVTFEEPVVMNGKRSPAGLAIENDSPIAKRFNEGSIDLEGKFTPKEVNEGSGVKESHSERSEGAQAKDTPETENPVVGENETPKFEEVETNEGLQLRHKVGDENSYEFFNPETLKWEPTTKQFFDERVARDGVKAKPVEKTIGESATGNTPEEAAQIHNEEMNNVEPTSTTQVKNLEKYDIMFQSKEGKALLDKAKNDPNFGKTAEERVPSDKIVKDADGNIQSIEFDGVTYTRNEQGKYVNEKGDSQIQIETPDQNTFIDANVDKRITIDKENNKILKIGSDDMTIGYDSNGQPREVSVWSGESINLSTGDYSQDYHSTYVDPAGRVIENKVSIDVNERKYYPDKQEGFRYSDHGEDSNGNYIDYNLRQETENSLSKLIKDAQLENRGLRTTKKGRQKAYDDVRNQIEDAYNNSKIDRETADNLHAKLNEKAKANGLETQETPTMVAEREALAKWNEQADTIKGDLMSVIEKSVDSQVAHDRMVEIIGEHCKNGKIDMNRANELYDALETKANSIDGVESLAKKAERINAELKAHEIKFAEESQGQKEPLTKESLEKDIEALKQGDDVSEYLGKLDEAKKQGILTEDEVVELTQKATEKVNEVVIPEIKIEYATEEDFPETPTKPKQLEKKTLEDILGDEQAPKTADEAKKYAEEHEDAEYVASDDPNICDMLFLDKDHDNIIYYNKDGVKAYREYNPSEAIERRDTSLYSDGTVESVETRTVDGNLKVEAYDPDGNLKRKELYDTDNGVWTAHQVYFDSEGNMIVARKVVLNKETKSWEPTAEYEYNTKDNVFELKNEKGEVVSTVKYDEATEHWAEYDAEGKAIHEINKPESVVVEPTPVEEHQGVTEIESSTGEPTPVGENSENNPASEKVEKRNSDGTKIPKKFRGRDDVTYDPMTKTYTEITEMYGVTTESIYDSKGRLLQEVEGNQTKYYNPKGEVIAEQEITDHGIKRTEKSKDYDLDVLFNSLGEGEKITIKYHEDKKGNTAEPEEFIYNKDKNVYENKGPEGTVFKTVEYDAKNHKWTIKDAEGKKIDSQNNMKESHIKRNLGIGAGVLALGGVAYGISKFVKSDDDKKVEQPTKPTAKPAPKKDTPVPKAETKVTLDGKEGTIDGNGNLKIGDNTYPKNEDGTYTIDDKKYKVEDGKLVEVVDTPDDNGETGGADPETTDVTGTIGDKEYIIKDGKVSVDGEELTPDENGHYKIGDDKYKIEDGKLVKVEPEEPAKTDDTDAAQSDDSQTGGGRTGGSTSGTTGSQGGGRTGGSASGTTGSQGDGRTGGSTSGNTGATHHDTSRPVTTPRSEQSEESRHTGNTPVTDVTDPTEDQKQVAKTLQNEIANIKTQEELKAFFAKAISAYNAGKITLMQLDVLTLNEAIKIQNEQDAIQKPEFGLGEVTTPQETQPKEKREITPVERMELTESIRKARDREDIEKIQQKMRQYKVFPGRKNLRRAYKAKLRAIKHQDEPQKVEKYNKKFEKRMDKIENSKVYKNDKDQINRENFQEMKYLDDIIKRPKNFDDGTLNA